MIRPAGHKDARRSIVFCFYFQSGESITFSV